MDTSVFIVVVICCFVVFGYSLFASLFNIKNPTKCKKYATTSAISATPIIAMLLWVKVLDKQIFKINEPISIEHSGEIALNPKTEDEARRAFIGVWTYTQPINQSIDAFPFEWIKLVISADGTMVSHFAKPVDDNWGTGEKTNYKIITGKYADTGERWFGIHDGKTVIRYTYMNGKLFAQHISYKTMGVLERGDKNPFSK